MRRDSRIKRFPYTSGTLQTFIGKSVGRTKSLCRIERHFKSCCSTYFYQGLKSGKQSITVISHPSSRNPRKLGSSE